MSMYSALYVINNTSTRFWDNCAYNIQTLQPNGSWIIVLHVWSFLMNLISFNKMHNKRKRKKRVGDFPQSLTLWWLCKAALDIHGSSWAMRASNPWTQWLYTKTWMPDCSLLQTMEPMVHIELLYCKQCQDKDIQSLDMRFSSKISRTGTILYWKLKHHNISQKNNCHFKTSQIL
jgi:hypothetical protein